MRQLIKNIPVLGPTARRYYRRWTGKERPPYIFNRVAWDASSGTESEQDRELQQVANLLNYTKTSGTLYAATKMPAGYHTIELNGQTLRGQRNPRERLDAIPLDFSGKTVLDIGCNQGGMLFALRDQIASGTGIDFDTRMINVANRISRCMGANHLDFYVFDLATEQLDIIRDLLPTPKVDIAFLLAVCMWIPNWREVIQFTADVSDQMVFESNGSPRQQQEQISYLESLYGEVTQLTASSDDDATSCTSRQLYLCR
ncbi:MAG: methyltransferase domain-containing protein [Phycisphaeraceae bacterium]